MHKEWHKASDLAGLPGLKVSERMIQIRAKKEGWKIKETSCLGGRRAEYHISSLPTETREYLEHHQDKKVLESPKLQMVQASTEAALPAVQNDTTRLKGWQRRCMDARLAILHHIDLLAVTRGTEKAIRKIIELAAANDLPAHLAALLPVANARSGGKEGTRKLSRPTLYNWLKLRNEGNAALAPKEPVTNPVPEWAAAALALYRQPGKPSIPDVHEELKDVLPPEKYPSVHALRRFLTKKMSRLDVQRGRQSPGQIRNNLKQYVTRSTEEMWPLDAAIIDGHSFKARVAHPLTGMPFKPEVCGVVEIVTRVCLGWSAGLAESAETVADALRHAVTVNEQKPEGGIPAMLYTDRGAGNLAHVNSDELTGLYARLRITHMKGRPGNAQGRGRIERLQGSLWVRAAKKLPTFTGKDMDPDVARTVYLTTNREIKQNGKSSLLISWQGFMEHCQREVDKYNRRPHSQLPKINDPETGRRRHMCPLEAWSAWLVKGWQPEYASAAELEDLYRPRVTATCRRGFVRALGGKYGDRALEHYDGYELQVGYDIHDSSQVWVYDGEDRLICKAKFEPTKRSFFPIPEVEQARERRASRRLKLVDQKREEILLEKQGPAPIATETEEIAQARQAVVISLEAARHAEPDPAEMGDAARFHYWKELDARVQGGETLPENTQRYYNAFKRTDVWRHFTEMESDLALENQ